MTTASQLRRAGNFGGNPEVVLGMPGSPLATGQDHCGCGCAASDAGMPGSPLMLQAESSACAKGCGKRALSAMGATPDASSVFGASGPDQLDGVFGPGTAAPPSSWASSSGATYTWRTFYYAHEDWSEDQLSIIDRAFKQINENLDIVSDYYDQDGVAKSGACHTNLLSGGSWTAGHLHLKPWDGVHCWPEPGTGFIGCTSGLYMKLNENYIQNGLEAFASADRGHDTGESACLAADIAATIVHESTHSCLGNEKIAQLTNQFYFVRFAANHGWSHENCCGEELASWDPSDWTLSDLQAAVSFQPVAFTGCTNG